MFDDRSDIQRAHDLYAAFRENMTEKTAGLVGKHFATDARFIDPLCEAAGRDGIVAALRLHTDGCEGYKFRLIDKMWGADERTAYWRWDVRGHKNGAVLSISGMSEITFDLKNKIISQIDYWDTGRARLPQPSPLARIRRFFGTG